MPRSFLFRRREEDAEKKKKKHQVDLYSKAWSEGECTFPYASFNCQRSPVAVAI